ncbi:hypothetical protein B566_EDAN002423 [Ephemera danica]|nr:hypothetical protein B566_EDAN002423 [Ephemera danica]
MGPLDVLKLGRTLTHEHLSATPGETNIFYTPAPEHIRNLPRDILKEKELTLQNFGLVRQYPYSNKENIIYDDEASRQAVLWEMDTFRAAGGCSIVENTSHGIGRNLPLMLEASKQSGVNIIAGTGFYVHQVQSTALLNSSTEDLADIIRKDLTLGCTENTEVKCGVIAEVGSGWPLDAFERRAIQATAVVQNEVGCGVSFHPGRDPEAPSEIARVYLEAGGAAQKAVMSHLDRTISDRERLLDFGRTSGFYCQYDLFGMETSLYQLQTTMDMPSDAQRIDRIKWLLEDGHKDRVLMSHDIGTKHRLIQYGGHGFSHILLNVVPQMRNKGISQDIIDHILVHNPREWLGVPINYQPRIVTID